MPLPSLELDKNTCLTRSRGSRHGVVVCSDCVQDLDYRTGYWLRSQLWHMTAASQWRIVEIEFLLAMAGWMWDCQPFKDAYVCSMWCAAERRFVGHVCLRNPFLPFKEFQASTPYQKLQVPESHSTLHQFWIIASSPSLCCSCRKNLSKRFMRFACLRNPCFCGNLSFRSTRTGVATKMWALLGSQGAN